MQKKNPTGFTLLELIVVIAILAILALLILPQIFGYTGKAKDSVCNYNRGILKQMYEGYVVFEKKTITDSTVGVDFLVSSGYVNSNLADKAPLNSMVWRVYDNGAVDVFCTASEANVATYLYQNKFDSMEGLTVLTGSFKVADGSLKQGGTSENRAIFKGSSGTDYAIEMNAVYLNGSKSQSGYGIYYRATETANISGYAFQFDPGSGNAFVLREVVNGKETSTISRVTMSSTMGSSFDINKPHDIKIDVVGDKHVITVDGVEVMSLTNSTFNSGSVGVRTWNNSDVNFNEVTITKK